MGWVIGEVIHDNKNKILKGLAMIAAYELESKCAVYPRIVKESNDTYYIDYFNLHNNDKFRSEEVLNYFERFCNKIAKYVKISDMSIRIKYL